MLIQYLTFWKKDPNVTITKSKLNLKFSEPFKSYLKNIEIVDERESVEINLQVNIKPSNLKNNTNGWLEVSTEDLKRIMNVTSKIATRYFNPTKMKGLGVKEIGRYQVVVTGAEVDFWTKSKIDIHKFKFDTSDLEGGVRVKDIEAENNLEILNRQLFGGKRMLGDRLANLKLPTTIFGLGINSTDEIHTLPKTYLICFSMVKDNSNKELLDVQNKQSKLTISTIISNFGRLLTNISKLKDLYMEEYTSISKGSQKIREKALKLQMKINDLLATKSDSTINPSTATRKLKLDTDDNYTYHGMEETLLLEASGYLSYLTEINQLQAQANYLRQEASSNIDKINQTLGLESISLLTESSNDLPSLNDEFKALSDFINYNFQNLKIELDHSQNTIRNTVDILKTFLESEQRIVSQRSSEAINWIVIVFAGLGLADALGNFVIFWLEGGSWYQAMFWFFVIIITLIIIIVVLYFWYFKTPNYLKILKPKG